MNRWDKRPPEEQRLLNPGFCSLLLWHSAYAHAETDQQNTGISFEECFLILPMVLHRETRESLPTIVTVSLPVWLGRNPFASANIAARASSLVPFTKEALRFGGAHGALQFNRTIISANPDWKKRMAAGLRNTSGEVIECTKRAEFLGKWFAKTGTAETVFSLLGVQP
jgi:hypothetical protein